MRPQVNTESGSKGEWPEEVRDVPVTCSGRNLGEAGLAVTEPLRGTFNVSQHFMFIRDSTLSLKTIYLGNGVGKGSDGKPVGYPTSCHQGCFVLYFKDNLPLDS